MEGKERKGKKGGEQRKAKGIEMDRQPGTEVALHQINVITALIGEPLNRWGH